MSSPEFKLLCTAFTPEQFPPEKGSEIILIGRSNVGKSSLLNQIAGKGAKRTAQGARVSQTPGCTQSINFYHYKADITLVDFPGFGYARWPAPLRRKIEQLIERYLFHRSNMALIVHIIDARLPLQKIDSTMLALGKKFNKPYLLTLNKCDKLSRQNMLKKRKEIEDVTKAFGYEVSLLTASALTGEGIAALKRKLQEAAATRQQQA